MGAPLEIDRRNIGSVMPANAATGRSYSGINISILWTSADTNDSPSHAWMTFKQALEKGAHVRKGERGTHVVFTKSLTYKGEDEEIEKRSMLREYTVFNIAPIDGFRLPETPVAPEPARHAAVDAFIAATDATIRHGGDKACFVPMLDLVNMPPTSSFKSIEAYYATALHEAGRWSGKYDRGAVRGVGS